MKMILAIVQDEDAANLLNKLMERHLRATKISSTGGFLRSGNTSILIGVEDDQVQEVLDILRATCRTRKKIVPPAVFSMPGPAAGALLHPVEVEVGGANIFVWDIEQYVRI